MREWPKWAMVLVLLFGVGFLRMSLMLRGEREVVMPLRAVVVKPALVKSTMQRLEVKDLATGQILRVNTNQYPRYRYGDVIAIEGQIRDNNYVGFPKIELVKPGSERWWLGQIYRLRDRIEIQIQALFPEPQAALVAGIVFGIEGDLGKNLDEKMRTVGLVHVIVASGYNVSVVITYIAFLVKWVGQRWGMPLMVMGIVGYAVMAGLGPPIIRASIMGGASILAVIFGRQKHALLWLFFTAILMLLWNPRLYESLSFQLSFAATLAILTIQPMVGKKLLLLPGLVRDDAATTLAVQTLTLPLIWLRLGVVQPMSLIVNVMTLWLIPVVMLMGSLAIGVSFVSVIAGRMLAIPVQMILAYVVWIVEVFT